MPAGKYTLTVQVSDGNGGTTTVTVTITVTESGATLADTGDSSKLAIYFAFSLIASGIAGIFVLRQHKILL